MLSRKYYEGVAHHISSVRKEANYESLNAQEALDRVVGHLAVVFKDDNERFDKYKFFKASL